MSSPGTGQYKKGRRLVPQDAIALLTGALLFAAGFAFGWAF